jgi:hypothetical protein
MLNSKPEYKDILDGNNLEPIRGADGNKLLIAAMKKPDSENLRRDVKNAMLGYYDFYTAKSDPQMPATAYSVGLEKAGNKIE